VWTYAEKERTNRRQRINDFLSPDRSDRIRKSYVSRTLIKSTYVRGPVTFVFAVWLGFGAAVLLCCADGNSVRTGRRQRGPFHAPRPVRRRRAVRRVNTKTWRDEQTRFTGYPVFSFNLPVFPFTGLRNKWENWMEIDFRKSTII